jgi:hypothetical protein
MAKLAFSKPVPAADTDRGQRSVVADAPAEEKTVTVYQPRSAVLAMPVVDDFSGEWLRTDQRLPRINLVQKVSDNELVRNFGIGAFVLAKEVRLSDGQDPLVLTALAAIKDYIQVIPFDSGEQPAVFKSEEEVINAGGSLNFKDRESGNYFQNRAHIEFAIAATKNMDENELALFPYEFEDKSYAKAIYTVASSAYTSLAKELATMRDTNKVLRQGLRYGSLKMTAEVRKKNTKSWYVPVARFNGKNSPELIEFFETIEPALRSSAQG